MKNEKNLMQMVIAGLLSALLVVLVVGRGERVVVVNEGYSRPPVVSSSMLPLPDSNIDWSNYIRTNLEEEYFELDITDIDEIIDGDTIAVMMEVDDYHEKVRCKLRLAGINCPEEFDQVCYLDAIKATEEFFNPVAESISLDEICRYFVIFVDTDANNRAVVYIIREITDNRGNKTTNDLGSYLIKKQLAYPSLYFYHFNKTKETYIPYLQFARKHVELAINSFNKPYKSLSSIWSTDPILRTDFHINLDPYLDDENEDNKTKGDLIQIGFVEKKVDRFNFTGFSILDETAYYKHRFFIPEIRLGFETENEMVNARIPNIDIYTGSVTGKRTNWDSSSEAHKQPVGYIMGKNNWICDQGEFIFVRNPNRRIVMCAFWDGSETIQILEKDENDEYKLNNHMDALLETETKNNKVIDFNFNHLD